MVGAAGVSGSAVAAVGQQIVDHAAWYLIGSFNTGLRQGMAAETSGPRKTSYVIPKLIPLGNNGVSRTHQRRRL